MKPTGFDLLRHGDTGKASYRGQLDDALTTQGWQQLRQAVAGRHWDRILTSPLQRCAAFARELASQRALPLTVAEGLAEYHFGRWQGIPIAQIAEQDGEALAAFWADPWHHPPPGAETLAQFAARLHAALAANAPTTDERVLVITHGGAIRLLRCWAEQRSFADMVGIDVPHASLHYLVWPLPEHQL
ncbi:histidine phosphatase family protein [Lysobacteraceae bacterium NML08-0793]|nr:histidine phosphatase family protein [Xanthomonadaceae bacterium NML08-0793]